MREADNTSRSIFLSVVGAYVVRTTSFNDKHSCKLFKIAASFSSLVLLSSSVSTRVSSTGGCRGEASPQTLNLPPPKVIHEKYLVIHEKYLVTSSHSRYIISFRVFFLLPILNDTI